MLINKDKQALGLVNGPAIAVEMYKLTVEQS